MPDALDYRPSHGAVHYRPQSHLDFIRAAIVVPLALIVAIVLGGVYGRVELEIRSIYFKVGAVVAAGAAVGIATMIALRLSRVRTPATALLLAVGIGLAALYGNWVEWIAAMIGKSGASINAFKLLIHPVTVWRLMKVFNSVGV